MRVLCVVGTRPNFIKIAALYRGMRNRNDLLPTLLHTGQHYDSTMSKVFFEELEIPRPDVNLGVSGGSHSEQTATIMLKFEPVLTETNPDLVIVVGDVNSTLATALVAAKCGVPLAHVEAGLRSRDKTMPEELNRIVVDQLADFLFVTEQSGMDNLQAEGIAQDKTFLVGNVMIDTLKAHLQKALALNIPEQFNLTRSEYVLVTLHRPANVDNKPVLKDILGALANISEDKPVLLPLHPRTKGRIDEFGLSSIVENAGGLILAEPMGYLEFLCAMAHAYVVLTDSGGIQEETTILKVPCLTMRNNTERPVTIEHGTNQLVGTTGEAILKAYHELSKSQLGAKNLPPLWDGNAATRIIDILIEHV